MDSYLAVLMGVALAAACGFRVFVPLLALSLATQAGYVQVGESWQWLGSPPALLAFGVATVLEIGAYYVPWLDNLLDTLATPMAVAAGTIVSASFITDVDPLLKWTLALVLGGGAAGAVQMGTVGLRLASTAGSGGLANPAVATGEWVGAAALSVLALLAPVVAAVLVVVAVVLGGRWAVRYWRHRRARQLAVPRHS